MKFVIFISLLLCAPVAFGLKVELTHSESVSFIHFLHSGFNEPFSSRSVKEVIAQSKSNVFKNQALLKDYNEFKTFLQNGYNFSDEVQNRRTGFWAEDALLAMAISSKSLSNFENQLSVILPYAGIVSYNKIKAKAYPLFKKIFWNPGLKGHVAQIKIGQELLKKTNFRGRLNKVRTFYRSEYPPNLSFKVGLVPIPSDELKVKHTSATNLRDMQMVPYFVNRGIKENLDVIFHEFCHALYEGQSRKTKQEIDDFYLNNKDPHSVFVYRYLNEALATALGNGWYSKALYGKLSPKDWYNEKYINGLGKAFYPLITQYLKAGRGMDKAFMKQTINIAKKTFPSGPIELDPNFMAVRILSNNGRLDRRIIRDTLKTNFRVQSYDMNAPISDQHLKELFENPYKTRFLVTSNWRESFAKINQSLDLSRIKSTFEKQDNFWAIIPHKGSYFFWVNAQGQSQFQSLITKLKSLKKLPQRPKVIFL